jgi:hypothetical protein
MNCVNDFCKEWGMKINTNKTKVCKKGGKLRRGEEWWFDGQEMEIVKKV